MRMADGDVTAKKVLLLSALLGLFLILVMLFSITMGSVRVGPLSFDLYSPSVASGFERSGPEIGEGDHSFSDFPGFPGRFGGSRSFCIRGYLSGAPEESFG